MKRYIFLVALLFSLLGHTQNGINYKAIIKDNNGNVVANQSVTVQFSILQGVAQTNVYQETHTPVTNDNGLIIINIGEGTTGDVFADINWSADDHFLNVQIDTGAGLTDLGTTQFMAVPYALNAINVSGLEAIDEGQGMGWRLVGRNPDNYGSVGLNSVDLSSSITTSVIRGATGDYATAIGRNTTASDLFSTAMGHLTRASGETATAIGEVTEASGDTSTAMGNHTEASGNISTAMGFETDAIGTISLAAGHYTESSGDYSTSLGSHTRAKAFCTTAIGRYNVGFGNSSEWIESGSIFEIGNGTSDSNRHNALTVNKNGSHYIRSSSLGLSINAETIGLSVFGSGDSGIVALQSEKYGAITEGKLSGLLTKSSIIGNPNIILAGNSSTSNGDDGIITSDPNYLSSDMYLICNDDFIVKLDNNDNEDGVFRIKNGQDSDVFTVNESGNTSINGQLIVGDETIEDGGLDILAFSSSLVPTVDESDRLGGPNRRWLDIYATNGAIQTSDRREKKNIKDLKYGLAEVLKMNPVSFNWKNKNNPDNKLGLIAQDLQALIPEVVHAHAWEKDEASGELTKKELNRLGVYYSDLVPVLIKAIQQQQKIIENQKIMINKQGVSSTKQAEVLEALLTRVDALERIKIQ